MSNWDKERKTHLKEGGSGSRSSKGDAKKSGSLYGNSSGALESDARQAIFRQANVRGVPVENFTMPTYGGAPPSEKVRDKAIRGLEKQGLVSVKDGKVLITPAGKELKSKVK